MPKPAPPRNAHLCLVQPHGYVHSLALLDPLLHLREDLRRAGVEVSVGKNRLAHRAVNYVFGAHLGFDPEWLEQFTCVLVNLEKLTTGSIFASAAYVDLLRSAHVVDYSEENTRHHVGPGKQRTVLTFGLDHGLARQRSTVPLEQRPIDLLFIGSMTERRQRTLLAVSERGREVVVPQTVLYGRQRNDLVKQAKAVVSLNADESSIFEQVRAAVVMSLGTPLVSELMPLSPAQDATYGETVKWLPLPEMAEWLSESLLRPSELQAAQARVDLFHSRPASTDVARMWAAHASLEPASDPAREPRPLDKVSVDLSGGRYEPGWLNVGSEPSALPDVLLARPEELAGLPSVYTTTRWGDVRLAPCRARLVRVRGLDRAGSSLEPVVRSAARLLAHGGALVLEWPAAAPLDLLESVITSSTTSPDLGGQLSVVRADGCDERGLPAAARRVSTVRVVLAKHPMPGGMPTPLLGALEDLEVVAEDCAPALL